MQDNARPHVSRQTLDFMDTKGIQLLDWPACSPDCNVIENLWAIVVQRLYRGGKSYESIRQLTAAIKSIWDGLSQEAIRKLVDSFPSRLVEVSRANGSNLSIY